MPNPMRDIVMPGSPKRTRGGGAGRSAGPAPPRRGTIGGTIHAISAFTNDSIPGIGVSAEVPDGATPEQAEEVHAELAGFLRQVDAGLSKEIKILYGGSVTPDNAASLFAKQHIDGALVGGAALKTDSFIEICQAAQASAA